MLDKLDTLIAFAVVMLGVSLIITILTQIVASFLGLRGSNLLWGIEVLLKELDPELEKKLKGAQSSVRAIATEIITDPVISDSTFSRSGEMWLIGPVVGLLCRIPGMAWLIRRWQYATAIRAEELARMIEKKANSLTAVTAATAGSSSGFRTPSSSSEASAALTKLLDAPDSETTRKLERLKDALTKFVQQDTSVKPAPPNFAVQADKIFQQAIDAAQQSLGKLETSFNTVMDRVSQRFALETRLWTVAFAFLIAFGVHLDSFRLLDQLSANADVRSALVNSANSMLNKADTLMPPPGQAPNTAVAVSPKILNEALNHVKRPDTPLVKVGPIPDNTTTVAAAVDWLKMQPGGSDAVDDYQRSVVSVLRLHAFDINDQLTKAGIDLIPSAFRFQYDGKRNVLGILIAAALLSLGAPFWYNSLKNLSNLRTVVARKQEQAQPATA